MTDGNSSKAQSPDREQPEGAVGGSAVEQGSESTPKETKAESQEKGGDSKARQRQERFKALQARAVSISCTSLPLLAWSILMKVKRNPPPNVT